jgi:hypothetical protein
MITKYRIVIAGMFEPVAYGLRDSGIFEIERENASHIFFRISGEAVVGLLRPTDDGGAVEVLLTDGSGGTAARRLADQCRSHLQDYAVTGPLEQPWTPSVGTAPS